MSNGNGHHWTKFSWRDWSGDKALHPCSLAARGFWIEMLCLMHEGMPVGHLTLGGKPATLQQMAANAYCSEKEATKHLAELEAAGVFSRTTDGIIFSRRMVKDAGVSERAKAWGKEGGNPKLNGEGQTRKNLVGGLTPPLTPSLNTPVNHTLNGSLNPSLNGCLKPKNLESESESEKESLSSFSLGKTPVSAPVREPEPSVPAVWAARQQSAAEVASFPAPVADAIGQIARGLKVVPIPRGPDRWDQLDALAEGQRNQGKPQDPIRTPAEQYAALLGISVAEAEARLPQSEVA